MLFLAAIYPLSEKSALNLPGRMNTNNVTYFENKEEYLANKGVPSDSNNDVLNGVNEGEDGMEVVVLDGADEAAGSDQIGYEMYRAFWNLQVGLCISPLNDFFLFFDGDVYFFAHLFSDFLLLPARFPDQ